MSDNLEIQQILALLKAGMSISPIDTELFGGDVHWQPLFELAQKQGLIGLTFLGIQKLPESLRPDEITIMRWFGYSNISVGRNSVLNKKCSEIINVFAKDGYRSLIMKGQANASLYSKPNYRTPGDIDIWLEGDRKQIIKYLKNKAHVSHIQFHHADFDILPDVEIEVHFNPTLLYNFLLIKNFGKFFLKRKKNQWLIMWNSMMVTVSICSLQEQMF